MSKSQGVCVCACARERVRLLGAWGGAWGRARVGLFSGWPVRKGQYFLHAELAVRWRQCRSSFSWAVSEPYPSMKHRGLRTLECLASEGPWRPWGQEAEGHQEARADLGPGRYSPRPPLRADLRPGGRHPRPPLRADLRPGGHCPQPPLLADLRPGRRHPQPPLRADLRPGGRRPQPPLLAARSSEQSWFASSAYFALIRK